ncbi:hypothetical protein SLEP1_g19948 [Rubroshorea leprosula]|uniref:Vacuolar fusion protein MON1 homolog n=1 Tax=Rubroshorea leprosula TaxID=152421 RepID=A0AAV5J6Y7_9ROSI|nr:hypothetical protein SLEP1_g19948 [Rubroshorea leprosula]
MSSASSSSSSFVGVESPDRNSNPKPIDEQLESLTLAGRDQLGSNHQGSGNEISNGTLNRRSNEEDSREIENREGDSVERGVGGSSGVVWGRENSGVGVGVEVEVEVEVEGPPSPSSSGYAGERGSSSATSASRMDEVSEVADEIQEERNEVFLEGVSDSQTSWLPGKKHVDEDDASISWRKRKKHFFILSNSGKPIYSRYGDEHKLAGFSATLQAIISFVENGRDRINLVRAGKHQVCLYFLCAQVKN